MIDIDTSSKTEQRKFGVLMAVAIAALGLIRWAWHGFGHFPTYFIVVAAVFLLLGLAAPRALKPVFIAWMKFAIGINWVMTHLFLSLAFYGMFAPVRVILHFFSDDPLKRQWLPPDQSYWEAPEEQPKEFDRYRNQF